MNTLILVIIICAIGTYLMRLIPLYFNHQPSDSQKRQHLQAIMASFGPAAITALLVVAIWPEISQLAGLRRPVCTLMGLVAVYTVHRWRSGIALPTIAGVLGYGLVYIILTIYE